MNALVPLFLFDLPTAKVTGDPEAAKILTIGKSNPESYAALLAIAMGGKQFPRRHFTGIVRINRMNPNSVFRKGKLKLGKIKDPESQIFFKLKLS